MEQEGATESTNDEPALDVKQEEATDENTNPQSSETDNTDDLMEQSPCESNQQGRSGEVQDVDQPTHDQAASVMKQEEATGENTNPQSSETDNTDDPMVQSPCESNQQGRSGEVQGVVLPWKKFFVHLAGKTDSAHRDFVEKFNNIGQTEVDSPEGSDYILVFYPIVSQPEMDIGEAPESAPAGKPIILVVMHHTNNPDLVIAESGRLVNNPNVKLTVDCLFYEGKLLKCRRNETLLIQLKESFGVSETSQRNGQPASNVEQEVATGENTNPDSVNEATEQSPLPWKKFFVHLAGKTDNSHRDFVAKFKSIGQKEAKSPERSDYILVFCPIVSRVGTDIGEALESAPAGKPIILVVMHHTFNPDLVIANSRRLVKNQNVNLTVDCLIYEGELLKSHHNDTAWSEVKKIFGVSETSQRNGQPASNVEQEVATGENTNPDSVNEATEQSPLPWKKFFVHLAGKTDNSHRDFVAKFKSIGQKEAKSPERSDYILVFCPIVSRVGTDIGEALESAPAGKPIILVVMHHTFNPDLVIANSRRLVKNQNVNLTVDCLIYEGELLKSHHNDTAWSEVKNILGVSEVSRSKLPEITSPSWWNPLAITIPSWSNPFATSKRNDQPALGSRESPNPSNQPSGPAPTALQREMVPAELRKKFFVHLAGKTDNAHQGIVEKFKSISQTEVHSPEGSDYILVFCPIVSRVGTDIGEALESAPAGKPIILVVMHHTFNPDLVIANSRRLVKNQNVKVTVDCLIYEGELLKCHRNDTAWSEVQNILGVS